MNKYLIIAQIVVAVLLIAGILLQRREGGLGSAFGGGSDGGSGSNPFSTRRGAEQIVFYATIVLSIAFLSLALALKVTT